MSEFIRDMMLLKSLEEDDSKKNKLFERLGGRPTLDKVHKIFYDKLFSHPWLKNFFAGTKQEHLEKLQSDFMGSVFGGPKIFSGRMPIDAHTHMFITEEIYNTRHELLRESLIGASVPEQEREDWLRIDMAFKKVLIKKDVNQCKKRYGTDDILDFPNPNPLLKKVS